MTGVADRELTRTTGGRLREELYALLARRRLLVLEHPDRLRSGNDAPETTAHAQRELDWLDQWIAELRRVLGGAERDAPDDRAPVAVGLGARVTVHWDDGTEQTYRIVGPAASDPRRGWISADSPLGWRLLDRSPGERITVATPVGHGRLIVVAVD
jgi:transcription elongation GreA/GreB family factor